MKIVKVLKSRICQSRVGGGQNEAKRRVNNGLTFVGWPETGLKVNLNAAMCLLDSFKETVG